ncbi:hypothetical protein W02_01250 [Nitrospira sp. KM1]|uniref:redoxin domain-containing protein n=1 Tax=Nitrospira sp. KM1 TaxID=1936990 RepID=UPI0013A7B0CA|nr:redoxin domain-containing protein [Nitrospira sp. KM1]BCA52985.1 hypothetical protein W02_01250 [Nitrospira sp. KM1]
MIRIGDKALTFRFPAVVDGEVFYVDTEKLLGQWVVLSFVPVLGESERAIWNRQGKQLIALGAALLVVPSEARAVHQARFLRAGQMYFTMVGDPLERLQRLYGDRTAQSMGRGRTFLIDPEGFVRFHLLHTVSERGMTLLIELLQAHQASETQYRSASAGRLRQAQACGPRPSTTSGKIRAMRRDVSVS